MISIVIITHGNLGRELIKTAEQIVGAQSAITAVSLIKEDLPTLCQQIGALLDSMDSPEGTLILTDMLGGTPCNASLPFSTKHHIEIISGVNLYMVLSALLNRANLGLAELAKRVIHDGQKNIANARELFLKRMQ